MRCAVAVAVCAFALLSAAAVRAAEAEVDAAAAAEARVAHILATSRVPHHVSDELMYTVLYDADAREGAAHTFGADEVVSRFMELQLHRCRADGNHWFSLSTMHEGEKRGRDGCGECAIMLAHAHTQPAALSFLETSAAGGAESEADAAHGLVSAVQRGCKQLLAAPCCANAPEAQGGDLLLEAQAHLERVLPEQLEGASLLEATSEYWTHRRAKALPKNLRFGVAAEDDSEDDAAAEDEAESDADADAEDVETVLLATSERVEATSRAALRASMRQQRAALLNGVSARSPVHELDFVDRIVRALDEQMSRPDSGFDTTLIGRLLNRASGADRIRVPTPADNIPPPKHFDLIAASTDVRDKEAALNAADEAADIAAEQANPWQPKRKSRAVRNVRKEHQRKAKLLRRLVNKRDGPVPTPNAPAKKPAPGAAAGAGAGAGTVKPAADYDENEISRLVVAPKPKAKPAADADADAEADGDGDTDAPAGFAAPKPAAAGSAKVNAAHAAVSASKAATATEGAAAVKTNVALKLIKKVKSTATKAKAKAKTNTAAKKKSKSKAKGKGKGKGKGKKKAAAKKGAAKKPAAKKEDESVWDKIEHGVEDAAKAVKGAAEKAAKAVKKAFEDVANSDVVKSLKILFGASAVPDLNTPAMAAWKKRHLSRLANRMKAPVGDKWAPNANRPFHGHAKCDPVSGTGAAQRIVGVAESHGHMFSALSFGGDYIHGGFNGTTAEALKPCNGQFTQHGAGLGSEAFHQYRTKYNGGWPRWDSTSHQQMHVSWLKAAATRKDQYALKTIFLTAVHNDLICLLYKIMGRIPKAFLKEWERAGYKADDVCDDVPNYERQMRAAHELAAAESSWMGLAKTPAECRDLIAAGKLCAIQAGGEVGDMCGRDETPEACVDRIHSKGARVFQLCHLRNNRYSGIGMHTEYINTAGTILEILRDYKASGHNPSAEVKSKTGLLKVLAVVKDAWNRLSNTVKAIGKELSAYPWRHEKHNLVGAPNTDIKYNPKGLSPLGVRMVERAVALKMPIDVSHASRETIRGVYDIAKKHSYFPFFSSHANIMETEDKEHATEYNIEFEELQRVLEVGGFVGMRPNPNTYPMYTKAKHRTTCQGSTAAFAQNTEFLARELAIPITFATDFNGAASNLHPRFYNKKADTHKIWTFESCRGERSCLNNSVSPLDWFIDASVGDAITNTVANLKAVFSKSARDEQLDKSGKCAKELTEILAEQQFQNTHAVTKVRADPTAVFDTTGLGRIDGLSHAAKDMAQLGASMNCPVCMLSGAENAIRTWERAFIPGTKRTAMPVKSFLMPEPGSPVGPKALLDTLSYSFDGPFKGPYTTDEQYAAAAPDNCLPQIAHDA